MPLRKGDKISFRTDSEAWKNNPSQVWEVDYVNPGCQNEDCGHDDCSRRPFVVVRPQIYYGFPLTDVKTIFDDLTHRGRELTEDEKLP